MICSPITGFIALGFFFGLVLLLTGIAELIRVTSDKTSGNRGLHLGLGIIDIILGIVFISHIAISVAILRIIVGIWFLFRGVTLISFSRHMQTSWMLMLGGIVTALFGLMIIFNAVFGSLTVIFFMAFAFIIMGIFNAWLGYNMKPR